MGRRLFYGLRLLRLGMPFINILGTIEMTKPQPYEKRIKDFREGE